jgi:hypothetical protein
VAPTPLRSTETIPLLHDSLPLLATVGPARRAQMGCHLREDIGTFRWPKQQVRLPARVVKRARSRSERKKPEQVHAPLLELDLDFHQIVVFVAAGGSAGSPSLNRIGRYDQYRRHRGKYPDDIGTPTLALLVMHNRVCFCSPILSTPHNSYLWLSSTRCGFR